MPACFECDGPAVHYHHVVPRVKGGTRTVPLCRPCHGKAHGIDGVTLGFGTAHPSHVIDAVVEMYEDGWNLKEIGAFWSQAGLKPLRGEKVSGSSFYRALKTRGVQARRPGPRAKVKP